MGEGKFRLGITHGDGWVEATCMFLGGEPAPVSVEMVGLDHVGLSRWGDGVDLGLIDRDLRIVIYDPRRVDQTSAPADFKCGLSEGHRVVLFLRCPDPDQPGGQDTYAFSATLLNDGTFEVTSIPGGELALALKRGVEMPESHDSPVESEELHEVGERPYFTALSVSGYRGFAETATLNLAIPNGAHGSGMTVIVGANNSGKSTFLEALHYIARARSQTTHSFPQPRRNQATDSVEIRLQRQDGVALAIRSLRQGGSQAESAWSPSGSGMDRFEIHVTPARRVFNPYFSQHGSGDRDWGQREQEFSRTQPRDNFASRLQVVDRDESRRAKFDPLLAEIVGEPLDWTIDEMAVDQQFVKLNGTGGWYTSEGLGEGLVSLLFIVDALYDSEPGSLIAIDEPEMSLHPQLIKRLRKVLARFAASRQIVVSTHSPHLIDWEHVANGASVARVFKRDGCSRVAQASSDTLRDVARLTDSRNVSNPHTVGTVAREAFFLEDGVILTEGQDDVAYMPRVLANLGLDPTENLFGWGAGGAHNIPKLAKLFLELGFTRVGAVLDCDKRSVADELNALGSEVVARVIPAPDIRYKKASDQAEVIGLLSEDGKTIRPEYRDGAKAALGAVLEHVSPAQASVVLGARH